MPTNSQHWSLASGKFVEEIYEEGIRMASNYIFLLETLMSRDQLVSLPFSQLVEPQTSAGAQVINCVSKNTTDFIILIFRMITKNY